MSFHQGRGGNRRGGNFHKGGASGGRHGGGGGRRGGGKDSDVPVDENNPVVQCFREYARELDAKHDRYERIVKCSRDITIESKRIIFLLHTVDSKWVFLCFLCLYCTWDMCRIGQNICLFHGRDVQFVRNPGG